MAVFKCKMCGGNLNIDADINVVECEYCGTTQTVPTADNEKKMSLFARANKLRAACDFDKAAGVYESIVTEFPEEAEAYWGLVLCKYGIEYVDDPATGKKVPTCHRSSFECILDDSDFEMVMENADSVARKVYRDEAKTIEELRKAIIEISGKEDPYDIFICYKETAENGDRTIDSVIAQDVYDELTAKGYRVFFSRITLEDKLGQEYEPYIFAALNSAKVMLTFGTDYEYYNAVWVKNEWSRFLQLISKGEKKTLIPCYKNIDAYDMPKEFAKLQAQDMGKVGAVQDLLRGIEKIIPKNEPVEAKETVVVNQSGGPNVEALLKRVFMFLEDSDWKNADEYCEKVLDIDPENAEAYLGKLLAELKVNNREELKNRTKLFDERNNYQKILRFGNEKLKAELAGYLESINAYNENKRMAGIYEDAKEIMDSARTEKEYQEAVIKFNSILEFEDSARLAEYCQEKAEVCKKISDEKKGKLKDFFQKQRIYKTLLARGEFYAIKSDGTVLGLSSGTDCGTENIFLAVQESERKNILCIKADGTVVGIGKSDYDHLNVEKWTDIVSVAIGRVFSAGLKADGTVVITKVKSNDKFSLTRDIEAKRNQNLSQIANWNDIVDIAVTGDYDDELIGLKSDGTIVSTWNLVKTNFDNVKGISTHSASYAYLFDDGTVWTSSYDKTVESWTDIVSIALGFRYMVGLKSDGTVVASGENDRGQCNVSDWRDIVAIASYHSLTVGVKRDGTVVVTGGYFTPKDIENWKLFDNAENLEEERKTKMWQLKKQILSEKTEKKQAARRKLGRCQYCGGTFKGLFTKKCSNCGKEKDY